MKKPEKILEELKEKNEKWMELSNVIKLAKAGNMFRQNIRKPERSSYTIAISLSIWATIFILQIMVVHKKIQREDTRMSKPRAVIATAPQLSIS